jgi:O-methyltransferase
MAFAPWHVSRFLPPNSGLDERLGRKLFLERAFRALSFNGIPGDYAEFGCWSAATFKIAYRTSRLIDGHPRHLWGFDSFAGLPAPVDRRDAHPMWKAGGMAMSEEDFRQACAAAGMNAHEYTTVPGFYERTLRDPVGPRPQQIALAYVDCDMYSSTREVLAFLAPRLQQGMVIAFDDYFCFGPDATSGNRLAAGEFFAGRPDWRPVPFLPVGWHGMSFMMERADLGPPASALDAEGFATSPGAAVERPS